VLPILALGKQILIVGDLAMTDGTNGGLGSNYRLAGGSHYGAIFENNASVMTYTLHMNADIVLFPPEFRSTIPDLLFITVGNYKVLKDEEL
jgi:hypothetical protein